MIKCELCGYEIEEQDLGPVVRMVDTISIDGKFRHKGCEIKRLGELADFQGDCIYKLEKRVWGLTDGLEECRAKLGIQQDRGAT
jgi:hypothetical protein